MTTDFSITTILGFFSTFFHQKNPVFIIDSNIKIRYCLVFSKRICSRLQKRIERFLQKRQRQTFIWTKLSNNE